MNYKTITNRNTTTDWDVQSFDQVHVVDERVLQDQYGGDIEAYKRRMKATIISELVTNIMEHGGIQIMAEYDIERQRHLLAGRCKWLIEKEEG